MSETKENEITEKDLSDAVSAEMALFLEENRKAIIERAMARLVRIREETKTTCGS